MSKNRAVSSRYLSSLHEQLFKSPSSIEDHSLNFQRLFKQIQTYPRIQRLICLRKYFADDFWNISMAHPLYQAIVYNVPDFHTVILPLLVKQSSSSKLNLHSKFLDRGPDIPAQDGQTLLMIVMRIFGRLNGYAFQKQSRRKLPQDDQLMRKILLSGLQQCIMFGGRGRHSEVICQFLLWVTCKKLKKLTAPGSKFRVNFKSWYRMFQFVEVVQDFLLFDEITGRLRLHINELGWVDRPLVEQVVDMLQNFFPEIDDVARTESDKEIVQKVDEDLSFFSKILGFMTKFDSKVLSADEISQFGTLISQRKNKQRSPNGKIDALSKIYAQYCGEFSWETRYSLDSAHFYGIYDRDLRKSFVVPLPQDADKIEKTTRKINRHRRRGSEGISFVQDPTRLRPGGIPTSSRAKLAKHRRIKTFGENMSNFTLQRQAKSENLNSDSHLSTSHRRQTVHQTPPRRKSRKGSRDFGNTIDFKTISNYINTNNEIGHGTKGLIYKGQWKSMDVAIKVFSPLETGSSTKREIHQEMLIWSNLKCENIVKLYGACLDPKPCFVIQLCEKGTLRDVLSDTSEHLTWTQKLKIVLGISLGMKYLHSKELIHGELKSSSILLTSSFEPKISNVFLNKLNHQISPTQPNPDTQNQQNLWTAPEILQKQQNLKTPNSLIFTKSANIFSFGVIMSEIATETLPYNDELICGDFDIFSHVFSLGKRPRVLPSSAGVPGGYNVLMRRCWDSEPEKRPPFQEIVSWVQELEAEDPVESEEKMSPHSSLKVYLQTPSHNSTPNSPHDSIQFSQIYSTRNRSSSTVRSPQQQQQQQKEDEFDEKNDLSPNYGRRSIDNGHSQQHQAFSPSPSPFGRSPISSSPSPWPNSSSSSSSSSSSPATGLGVNGDDDHTTPTRSRRVAMDSRYLPPSPFRQKDLTHSNGSLSSKMEYNNKLAPQVSPRTPYSIRSPAGRRAKKLTKGANILKVGDITVRDPLVQEILSERTSTLTEKIDFLQKKSIELRIIRRSSSTSSNSSSTSSSSSSSHQQTPSSAGLSNSELAIAEMLSELTEIRETLRHHGPECLASQESFEEVCYAIRRAKDLGHGDCSEIILSSRQINYIEGLLLDVVLAVRTKDLKELQKALETIRKSGLKRKALDRVDHVIDALKNNSLNQNQIEEILQTRQLRELMESSNSDNLQMNECYDSQEYEDLGSIECWLNDISLLLNHHGGYECQEALTAVTQWIEDQRRNENILSPTRPQRKSKSLSVKNGNGNQKSIDDVYILVAEKELFFSTNIYPAIRDEVVPIIHENVNRSEEIWINGQNREVQTAYSKWQERWRPEIERIYELTELNSNDVQLVKDSLMQYDANREFFERLTSMCTATDRVRELRKHESQLRPITGDLQLAKSNVFFGRSWRKVFMVVGNRSLAAARYQGLYYSESTSIADDLTNSTSSNFISFAAIKSIKEDDSFGGRIFTLRLKSGVTPNKYEFRARSKRLRDEWVGVLNSYLKYNEFLSRVTS